MPGPPDPADQHAERDALWALLRALPAKQRAVLVLRFYQDLTEEETARVLGVSLGTVKSQSSRAIATLRRRLGAAPAPGGDVPGKGIRSKKEVRNRA